MRVSSPPTRQATGPGPSLWMGLVACATWLGFAGCSGGGSSIGSGTVPPPPDPPPVAEASFPVFEDVSASAGVAMPHHGAPIYLSTGQAWGDYDRDGWIDLYVTDQDGENVLYRNQGDGTFQPSPVSAQVALPSATSGGALFADYDNDGWLDLLVLNFGPNVLFRNLDGQGFADVSLTAGIGDA
ncbi:MAG: VCBS repeat-containing protein, partial [Planctomycetota bacterium]|nr:VCBS repeat-containing protein [Planctomycetota bacterium]